MRRLYALLVPALLASAVACGSDSSTGPSAESVSGTYNLSTVNTSPLPFILQASNPKVELLSDQIVVSTAGTFTDNFNFRFTDLAGQVTTEAGADPGTWTLNGSTISFRYTSDGGVSTGTVNGNNITIVGGGFTQVYVKQ
jgi:hypothetical protein